MKLKEAKVSVIMMENQESTIQAQYVDAENQLALLPLKNVVILPKSITPIIAGRPKSIAAIEHALKQNKSIFITTQKGSCILRMNIKNTRILTVIALFLLGLFAHHAHAIFSNLYGISSQLKEMTAFDKKLQSKSVWMDNEDSIELIKGETEPKSIFSFGFAGCTGIATYIQYANGDQKAILAHYSPMGIAYGKIEHLKRLYNRQVNGDNTIENSTTIILHPIDWEKNPISERWEEKPQDQDTLDRLSNAVNNSLGSRSVILTQFYSMSECLDGYSPYGKHGDTIVPKQLGIVLMPENENSFWRSSNAISAIR